MSLPIDIPINYDVKNEEIIIDNNTLKDGETKIIKVWSWKRFKNLKLTVTKSGNRIFIRPIEVA